MNDALSVKSVTVHGNDVVADAPEKRLGLCISTRCAQSGEQRQQVFIGGVRALTSSLLAVGQQSAHIALRDVLVKDEISTKEKIKQLGSELADHYEDPVFSRCSSMGELIDRSLKRVLITTHVKSPL